MLRVRALPEGRRGGGAAAPGGMQRFTCAALTARGDSLALTTDAGQVFVLQPQQRRFVQLDPLGGGAGGGATAAAFMARDRRLLFVAARDGGVRCYDLATRAFATLPGCRAPPRSLSVRAGAEQLAAAAPDGVCCWRLDTLQRSRLLDGAAPYGVLQAHYSPDEHTLVAAAADGSFTVWSAKSLRPLGSFRLPRRPAPGAAPDGAAGEQPAAAAAGAPVGLFPGCFAITPDSRTIVVGTTAPALLLVYDAAGLALRHAVALPRARGGVATVQPLPDARTAAVLCADGSVCVVDFEAGSCEGELRLGGAAGAAAPLRADAIYADARGNLLAALTDDGCARLFDLAAARAALARRRGAAAAAGAAAGGGARRVGAEEVAALPAALVEGSFPVPIQLGAAAAAAAKAARGAGAGGGGRQKAEPGVLSDALNLPRGAPRERAEAAPGKPPAKPAAPSAARAAAAAAVRARPLDAAAAAVSRARLEEMLVTYGEYPPRYRLLIWEHLLALPRNTAAFRALEDRGAHPAFVSLPQRMADCRAAALRAGGGGGGGERAGGATAAGGGCGAAMAQRLQRTLSHLAHWCPLFAETEVAPRAAFPLVQMFGANAHGAFEAAASILTGWGSGWFECFPAPPVGLLRRFVLMVQHHDPEVPVLRLLWHQVSGLLTDLLVSTPDWLAAFDHVLTWGPQFQYELLAAYLITFRSQLLSAADEAALELFFATPRPLRVQSLVRRALALRRDAPPHVAVGPAAARPLPRGQSYPDFTEYPVSSAEAAAAERRRIEEAEVALARRRVVAAELEARTKAAAFEADALASQREQLAALDAQRREASRAAEAALASELARLDDRAKQERLRQVQAVERAYEASVGGMRSQWQSQLAALRDDLTHRRRLMAHALGSAQEEEELKVLEFQAQQRLWALQQDAQRAAAASSLQDAAAARQAALESEARRRAAEWQAEDEARALARRHEAARAARATEAAEAAAAQAAAQGLLLAEELRAREAMSKLDSDRLLRRVAEGAAATARATELTRTAAAAAAAAAAATADGRRARACGRPGVGGGAAEDAGAGAGAAALRQAAEDLETSRRLGAAAAELATLRAATRRSGGGGGGRLQQDAEEEEGEGEDGASLDEQLQDLLGRVAAASASFGGDDGDGAAAAAAAAGAARGAGDGEGAWEGGAPASRRSSTGTEELGALEREILAEAAALAAPRARPASDAARRRPSLAASEELEALLAEAEEGIAAATSALEARAPRASAAASAFASAGGGLDSVEEEGPPPAGASGRDVGRISCGGEARRATRAAEAAAAMAAAAAARRGVGRRQRRRRAGADASPAPSELLGKPQPSRQAEQLAGGASAAAGAAATAAFGGPVRQRRLGLGARRVLVSVGDEAGSNSAGSDSDGALSSGASSLASGSGSGSGGGDSDGGELFASRRGAMAERVSRLRRSSSATSEDLEQLLGQLAAAEARLLQSEAGPGGAAGAGGGEGGSPTFGGGHGGGKGGGRGRHGGGGGGDGDSVSWSQTMEDLGLGALLAA
ncbi:hypothetical protein Rsub_07293 [Raphidocelis subcapitata]|uniref:TBC1 domain family member 31 n=1 Tax=Raphidocelis subcapitata TaxID=307507 RepID=A0A2V0PA90_9CHLO|nr:hypothetical protein Rsub_07293 [Raphidocelis subcapitata]|eukprot:GBF94025.1 hypothetical protein Rsub_07293 [Raphidocelis subcapitata]